MSIVLLSITGGTPNLSELRVPRSGCNSVTNTSTPAAYFSVSLSGRPSPVQTKDRPFQSSR
ncbi:hypothetical protein D9M69_628180 [compost metagenome]